MKELTDREVREVAKYARTMWAIYKELLNQVGYHDNFKWDYKMDYPIEMSAGSINAIRKASSVLYKVADTDG